MSEPLPSPGANGIGYGRFARSVKLTGVTVVIRFRPPPKARFFGAPPRFFAQEQRNGVESAVGGRDFCPGKRRTRTNPLQKSGEERIDYRLVALTRMVEPPR